MRIHTNKPEAVASAIMEAVRDLPGVYTTQHSTHRSRSRSAALELRLSGNSPYMSQGGDRDEKAATWDEWGVVLAAVFAADESATAGEYLNGEHFHWTTGNRFRHGMPEDTHARHKWEYQGTVVTGAYTVSTCKKCTAMSRRIAVGHTWEEIA